MKPGALAFLTRICRGAFVKSASGVPPLHPFQDRAATRFMDNGGLLVAHDTGMGKTRTAIEALTRAYRENPEEFTGLAVVPAALRTNFVDNAARYAPELGVGAVGSIKEMDYHRVPAVSYDFVRRNLHDLSRRRWSALVADELHHAKNRESGNYAAMRKLRGNADRFMGLTGSPIQNDPDEFQSIMSVVGGDDLARRMESAMLRARSAPEAWRGRFLRWLTGARKRRSNLLGIADPSDLHEAARDWVDFASADGALGRPRLVEKDVRVNLPDGEWHAYLQALKGVKRFRKNPTFYQKLTGDEMKRVMNAFAPARQALLSPDVIDPRRDTPAVSAKGRAVGSALKDEPGLLPAVVFSNFLDYGAGPLDRYLDGLGLRSSLIHGGMTDGQRDKIIAKFREGLLDTLVMSPVGGEGVNLPGARSVHVADPHWNPEVMRQMIGRALRLDSKFPELEARYYTAAGPAGENTVDDIIMGVVGKKRRVNKIIRDIVSGENVPPGPVRFRE